MGSDSLRIPHTSWSHGGRILFNASRVYYLPDEKCIPPLRWMPERQRFEYLSSENDEDISLRASLVELAESCSALSHLQLVQQQSPAAPLNGYLRCEALYGVLPLGAENNSALLYVTEQEFVCTLCVGGASHDVFAVRGLQWLFLPCATSALSGRRQGGARKRLHRGSPRRGNTKDSVGGEHADSAGSSTGSDEYRDYRNSGIGDSVSESEDDDEEDDDAESESDGMRRLPTKTLYDYLAVLNRFCESINTSVGVETSNAAAINRGSNHLGQESASRLPGIVGPANRFSYLYYSPTVDLSADPIHLVALSTHSAHPHIDSSAKANGGATLDENASGSLNMKNDVDGSDVALEAFDRLRLTKRAPQSVASRWWEERRAAAVTRQLYQWNGPLMGDAFSLPTLTALREEYAKGPVEGRRGSCVLGRSGVEPWGCVCADELLRDELMRSQQRGYHSGPATPALASTMPTVTFSSLPLYIPSFIRGLVAQTEASSSLRMTLITRLCCRWAGTRYNRRGLEPGHSGVVANMAMTSLWVTSQPVTSGAISAEKNDNRSDATRFAVYSVLRGSVPRRWEQPANLSLKPIIKIAPVGNAAEELGRHVRLLKQCLPHVHTLYCLDTMSTSKLEEPLSEAFAAAVRRYNEEPPSPSISVKGGVYLSASSAGAMGEDKDGAAAAIADTEEESLSTVNAPNRVPVVALVKYNVKKALKTLSYTEMMRECVAKLDLASGNDTWLDFTKGEALVIGAEGDGAAIARGHSEVEKRISSFKDTLRNEKSRDTPPRLSLAHAQSRLVRVNCLDCLDRTNLVQSTLLATVLPKMIQYVEEKGQEKERGPLSRNRASISDCDLSEATARLRLLLAAQGMAVSQLYAGTKPHFIPYLLCGHYRLSQRAAEGVVALRRWYQQNFLDGVKQDGVSLVTRQHDPQMFNADIESPFSRDLSGMNHQVFCGLLLGIMPFLYSLVMCMSEWKGFFSVFQLNYAICLCWVLYLSVLYNKLMRYRVTYTNRPLLLYTRQADWC